MNASTKKNIEDKKVLILKNSQESIDLTKVNFNKLEIIIFYNSDYFISYRYLMSDIGPAELPLCLKLVLKNISKKNIDKFTNKSSINLFPGFDPRINVNQSPIYREIKSKHWEYVIGEYEIITTNHSLSDLNAYSSIIITAPQNVSIAKWLKNLILNSYQKIYFEVGLCEFH